MGTACAICMLHAGQTEEDLRELTVQGTTFDPTSGTVLGLASLDRNMEVLSLLAITPCLYCFCQLSRPVNNVHTLTAKVTF